jgi:exoribonuclease R
MLKNISSLISSHLQYREKQGIVNCNIPTSKVTISNQPSTDSPTLQVTLDNRQNEWSSTLVTECMIIAGRVAALFAQDRKLSVPFRYHLDPSVEGGAEFLSLLDIVRASGSEASLYDRLRLTSFFKASAVDINPRPHWGLGLASYVKATSPLRRYFDLFLHQQISLSLDANTRPKSAEHVAAIIPTVYRHEQYLKRLERSSRRFWTIRYIEQLLCGQIGEWMPLKVTVIRVEKSPQTGKMQVFIKDFALRNYCDIPGSSQLVLGEPVELDLISADPIRQTVVLRIP